MNYFVFVVCGAREHIETLNFSLRFIRHFSRFPILVVTDSKRNEIPVAHDAIIDVDTPEYFDNHQASIYLKTGLHKHLKLETDTLYCYLDSDIIAIDFEINNIFDYYNPLIIFGKDHCPFNEFSPHVMCCNCLADTLRRNKEHEAVDTFFQQEIFSMPINEKDRLKLNDQFADIQKPKIKSVYNGWVYFAKRYILPLKQLKFGDFYFNKTNKLWYNADNEVVDFDFRHYAKKLQKNSGLRFDFKTKLWKNTNNEIITPQTPHCSHLSEHINKKYNIKIPDNWDHWNGGVFVFNKQSSEFMDFWHKISLEEFQNLSTKTRDQHTLAVSAWNFGLQDSKTLDVKYNFITEFNNNNIAYSSEKGFTNDGFKTSFKPYFLHIYHEWGHEGWSIWDYVTELDIIINKELD